MSLRGDGGGAKRSSPDARAEVVRVAEQHQEDAEGYGETCFNADTGAVLWVAGDWTDASGCEKDMLSIDGVSSFDYEMEGLPSRWFDEGFEVVHPADPPRWVTEQAAAADYEYEKLVALASEPLSLD